MHSDVLIGLFGLLFATALSARVLIVYRTTGHNPISFTNTDTAHDYVHKILILIIVLEGLNIIAFRLPAWASDIAEARATSLHTLFGPLSALNIPAIKWTGLLTGYFGLIWTVLAQHQMGGDWRIGIDADGQTSIVTRGLYAISRHPIYLGFMIITFGLFLMIPTIVSLLCAVLTPIVLSIQARLEEEFMLARHGDAYRKYLAQTRRWI